MSSTNGYVISKPEKFGAIVLVTWRAHTFPRPFRIYHHQHKVNNHFLISFHLM